MIKKGHPSAQGVYKGKEIKYRNSRKSIKEGKDLCCKANNQSLKVLKKRSLRSEIDLSVSSKHLLFLSLQRHHNKQWGVMDQIQPFQWRPKLPCQVEIFYQSMIHYMKIPSYRHIRILVACLRSPPPPFFLQTNGGKNNKNKRIKAR